MSSLPKFLRDALASPPRAGEGVHGWLFSQARQLIPHMPEEEIIELLGRCVADCGRPVPRREIEEAVRDAHRCAWRPSKESGAPPPPAQRKWPEVNHDQRRAIIHDGCGLVDLWEMSPARFDDDRQHTSEIIERLFPSDEALLCCGQSKSVFDTKRRREWRNLELERSQFVVPSAMSSVTGLTQDGKESKHALSNTGSRRFLVVEFDTGLIDGHAALLHHLRQWGPLVLGVHSGGKSLHGWFFVGGQDEAKVLKFFRYACSLGADPRMWTRSQFSRMPGGTRDNGERQSVFFFNPKPLETR